MRHIDALRRRCFPYDGEFMLWECRVTHEIMASNKWKVGIDFSFYGICLGGINQWRVFNMDCQLFHDAGGWIRGNQAFFTWESISLASGQQDRGNLPLKSWRLQDNSSRQGSALHRDSYLIYGNIVSDCRFYRITLDLRIYTTLAYLSIPLRHSFSFLSPHSIFDWQRDTDHWDPNLSPLQHSFHKADHGDGLNGFLFSKFR